MVTEGRKSYSKFKKKSIKQNFQTIESKIKEFILRNSKNGYYTKVSTIAYKFEIPQDKTWQIVGELLVEGKIESIHDEFTGEMKLCETGKTYLLLNLERQRKEKRSYGIKKDFSKKNIVKK
jgi:hypothetical protein